MEETMRGHSATMIARGIRLPSRPSL